MTVAIGGDGAGGIKERLAELMLDADAVDMAVSYVQVSGWKEIEPLLRGIDPKRVRLVCTDQLGITHPDAVRMIMAAGVSIRRYSGAPIYHPKVYLAHRGERPAEYVVGSANLSRSALTQSVEVVMGGLDEDQKLKTWFDNLFANRTDEFDEARLRMMARAVAARVRTQLEVAQVDAPAPAAAPAPELVDRAELLDSVFTRVPNVIATLGFDHAGNNVRNVSYAKDVVSQEAKWDSKQDSEMTLLGLGESGSPTRLGREFGSAATINEAASRWVDWLKSTPDEELARFGKSERLVSAKRAIENFWKMKEEVRTFFLDHAENPTTEVRRILQAIELLANCGPIARDMSLNDIRALSANLQDLSGLPAEVADTIRKYLTNKGPRNWDVPDRRIVPLAWVGRA